MNKQFAIVAALMSASVASSLAWADPDMPGFTVDFSQCTEFAGVETVAADIYDEASMIAAAAGMDAIVAHLPFVFDRELARTMGACWRGAS